MARYIREPKVKPHLKASSPEADARLKAEQKKRKKKNTAPNKTRKRPNRSRGIATLQKLKVIPPPEPGRFDPERIERPPAGPSRPLHELLEESARKIADDIRSGRRDGAEFFFGLGFLLLGAFLFGHDNRRPLLGPSLGEIDAEFVDEGEDWPEEL